MDDLISRQAAIDFIDAGHLCNPNEPRWSDNEVVAFLKSRPPAQPERKSGKWIKLDMHAHLADHKCTACGQECYVPTCMGEPMYTYCPNCGARIEGENETD